MWTVEINGKIKMCSSVLPYDKRTRNQIRKAGYIIKKDGKEYLG